MGYPVLYRNVLNDVVRLQYFYLLRDRILLGAFEQKLPPLFFNR